MLSLIIDRTTYQNILEGKLRMLTFPASEFYVSRFGHSLGIDKPDMPSILKTLQASIGAFSVILRNGTKWNSSCMLAECSLAVLNSGFSLSVMKINENPRNVTEIELYGKTFRKHDYIYPSELKNSGASLKDIYLRLEELVDQHALAQCMQYICPVCGEKLGSPVRTLTALPDEETCKCGQKVEFPNAAVIYRVL